MDKIEDANDKAKIIQQLDGFVEELAKHRSSTIKSFVPAPCFPLAINKYRNISAPIKFVENREDGYPLCHGDLHEGNVIVDPDIMKVKAVLDWEHCGYYPPEIDPRRCKAGRKYVVLADGTKLEYHKFGDRATEVLDKLRS